jgi:hypothetical protein
MNEPINVVVTENEDIIVVVSENAPINVYMNEQGADGLSAYQIAVSLGFV